MDGAKEYFDEVRDGQDRHGSLLYLFFGQQQVMK